MGQNLTLAMSCRAGAFLSGEMPGFVRAGAGRAKAAGPIGTNATSADGIGNRLGPPPCMRVSLAFPPADNSRGAQ